MMKYNEIGEFTKTQFTFRNMLNDMLICIYIYYTIKD